MPCMHYLILFQLDLPTLTLAQPPQRLKRLSPTLTRFSSTSKAAPSEEGL